MGWFSGDSKRRPAPGGGSRLDNSFGLVGRFFGDDRRVYCWAIGFTLPGALCGALAALPEGLISALHLGGFNLAVNTYIPLARLGLGWVCPALAGVAVGLVLHFAGKRAADA